MNEKINKYIDIAVEGIINYGPKILGAILVLIIGLRVLKILNKIVSKSIQRTGLAPEISGFISTLIDILLKAFLFLTIAGIIGVDTASLIAVLAAASFAVGLALQGSLSNFAAGILILIFKPYRVGEYVEMQDKFGQVMDIQIFNTILETPGNKTLIVPNGMVIDGIITNISVKGNIRLELEVTMPYSEDWEKVKEIIAQVLKNNAKVLEEPEMELGILTYDSHNIVIAVRPYVLPEDYWDAKFEVYASIKRAFHENNISVAYSEGVEIGKVGK